MSEGIRVSASRRIAGWRPWRIFLGYSRNVYLLLLYTLGKGLQISIAALSNNLYAHSLGYDTRFIGVFAAAPAIGALIAGIPVGVLADRIGRKPLLLISGFLNPLTLIAIGLSASAPLLIAASLLNGIFASAYWVTSLPLLLENATEEQRVGALAINNFLLLGIGALGALIGGAIPELAGHLTHLPASSTIPLRWGVLSAAIVTLLPTLPLILLDEPRRPPKRPAPHPTPVAPTASTPSRPLASASTPQETRGLGAVLLFTKLLLPDLLFTTGEGAVVGLLQLFFALKFGLQPGALGVIFTLAGLFGGASSLAAPRFTRRWGELRVATVMQYLSAPIILVIGFAPGLALAGGSELTRQALRGVFEPAYAAFALGRVGERQRATLSGFYSLTWSLGFSIGPTLAGWLQRDVSYSAAFIVGACCVTCSATLLRLFFRAGAHNVTP